MRHLLILMMTLIFYSACSQDNYQVHSGEPAGDAYIIITDPNGASRALRTMRLPLDSLEKYFGAVGGGGAFNPTFTSVATGEIIKWDGSNWINNTLSEAGIFDPTFTSVSSGEIIKWNGTNWVNNTLSEAGIFDPNTVSATSGDLIRYNGSTWNNSSTAAAGIVDKTGSPSSGYVPYFTDGNTIQGSANLQFDGSNLTVSDEIGLDRLVFNDPSNNQIAVNTTDGSDDGHLYISSASQAINSRGGAIRLWGNEASANAGVVSLQAGNTTGANVNFQTGLNVKRLIIDENGLFDFEGNRLTDLDDPTDLQDAATKAYVDANSGGSGDVSKVGTPVNNQIGIWTGDGTIEGSNSLQYLNDSIYTGSMSIGSLSGLFSFVKNSIAGSNGGLVIAGGHLNTSSGGRLVLTNSTQPVSPNQIQFYSGSTRRGFINGSTGVWYYDNNELEGIKNIAIGNSAIIDSDVSGGLILENNSAPTSSETEGIILYSEDVSGSAELKVRDEAGNVTLLSTRSEVISLSLSATTGDISTATAVETYRMPFAATLDSVRISVSTAPTGSTIIVDINESGSTVLSTNVSIDVSEKTSITSGTAAVISDSSLADDAELTFDIDQAGSTIAGEGLKITMYLTRI